MVNNKHKKERAASVAEMKFASEDSASIRDKSPFKEAHIL